MVHETTATDKLTTVDEALPTQENGPHSHETGLESALAQLNIAVQQRLVEIEQRKANTVIHLAIIASNEYKNAAVDRQLRAVRANGCLVAVGGAASLALLDESYWQEGAPQFVLLFDIDPVVAAATTVLIQAFAQFEFFEDFKSFIHDELLDVLKPLARIRDNALGTMNFQDSPGIGVWTTIDQNYPIIHQLAASGKMQSVCAGIDDPILVVALETAVPSFRELQNMGYSSNIVDYYAGERSAGDQHQGTQSERVDSLNRALIRLVGNDVSTLVYSLRSQFNRQLLSSPAHIDAVPADFNTILDYHSEFLRVALYGDSGTLDSRQWYPREIDELTKEAKKLIDLILLYTADDLQIDVVHPHFGTMTAREWITDRYGHQFVKIVEGQWHIVQDERRQFEAEFQEQKKHMRPAD